MAYEFKKGTSAVESATTEKKDYSKVIKTLKSGTSFKVRVPSEEEVVEVFMHSVYETFYSTPCTRDDLYDKAVALLRADQKKAQEDGDEKLAEVLGNHAYALTAKPRYLFGFYNLEDGAEMIVDLSKKQAQGVISTVKKNAKRLNQLAFEISKTGSGQSTVVGFDPLMFLDEDLTPQELKHYQATEGKVIAEDVYANCLYVKNEGEQAEDLQAYELKAKKDKKHPLDLRLTERLGLEKQQEEPQDDGQATEIEIEETDLTEEF